MEHERKYWFRAKRYGWGWGLPSTWQGWVVLIAYVCLVILSGRLLGSSDDSLLLPVSVAALTAGLIVVCLWKGEPPSWRWGGE